MADDTETKLSAARTRLILDKPFLGALVLRMPMKPADPKWCKTIGTDARAFYYNPDYIDSLSVDQTQFALAHEALHCALSHFYRRGHRNATQPLVLPTRLRLRGLPEAFEGFRILHLSDLHLDHQGETQLVSLVCLGDDLQTSELSGLVDPDDPSPGAGFFYVFRAEDDEDYSLREFKLPVSTVEAGRKRRATGADCPRRD